MALIDTKAVTIAIMPCSKIIVGLGFGVQRSVRKPLGSTARTGGRGLLAVKMLLWAKLANGI